MLLKVPTPHVSKKHDPAIKDERPMISSTTEPHDFLPLVEGILL